MGKAILEGAKTYSKALITAPYIGSKLAILNNNDVVSYSKKGSEIGVRVIRSQKGGLYDPSLGWNRANGGNGYGGEDTVEWKFIKPTMDAAKTLSVDLEDEIKSYTEGMPSSFAALIRDYVTRNIAPDFDQCVNASIFAGVPTANRFTDSEYPITADKVASTLLKTQALFKEFTEEPVLAFVSTEVHANLKEYLLESKAGAGNLYSTETISIDLEGFGEITEGEGQVNIKVNKFDDLYLIPVPTDRMHTLVTFLDGHSEGQEDGGYVPATEEVGYGKIHILAFPATSCYAAIKFLVANLHYPTEEPSLIPSASELAEIKTNLTGAVEFSSITPNELASEFAMNLRTVYGGGIVPGREETVYAVTTALKA